jgi:hypothetical protein
MKTVVNKWESLIHGAGFLARLEIVELEERK